MSSNHAASRFKSKLYTDVKIKYTSADGLHSVRLPDGRLWADGIWPTKLTGQDMPDWYVYGYMYHRHGYISALGVKHLVYVPNYTTDHLNKDDLLYISYNHEIICSKYPPADNSDNSLYWTGQYNNYDCLLSGPVIQDFIRKAIIYSPDIGGRAVGILEDIEAKTQWYTLYCKDM